MVKTISIPEDLHKELIRLKLDYGDKNVADMIRKLIVFYKQQRFLEHSKKFREAIKKQGISFEEFLKRAEKIREGVADELFPDK
jgi:predicted CopG family antitoxin